MASNVSICGARKLVTFYHINGTSSEKYRWHIDDTYFDNFRYHLPFFHPTGEFGLAYEHYSEALGDTIIGAYDSFFHDLAQLFFARLNFACGEPKLSCNYKSMTPGSPKEVPHLLRLVHLGFLFAHGTHYQSASDGWGNSGRWIGTHPLPRWRQRRKMRCTSTSPHSPRAPFPRTSPTSAQTPRVLRVQRNVKEGDVPRVTRQREGALFLLHRPIPYTPVLRSCMQCATTRKHP